MTPIQKKYIAVLRQFERATSRLGVNWKMESEIIAVEEESPLDTLCEFVKVSEPLYKTELKQLREKIVSLRRRNRRLFSPTTFEVMKRHALEESHSNVLAYLLEQRIGGKHLLRELLATVSTSDSMRIIDLLPSSEFEVYRERVVRRKKIDILVDSHNWMVILENKFYASLHNMEDDSKQTVFYYKEMTKRNPNKIVVGILLDYKGEEESQFYTTLDYSQLLRLLESARESFKNDKICEEYLFLLRRLSLHLDEDRGVDEGHEMTISQSREIMMETRKWHLRTS